MQKKKYGNPILLRLRFFQILATTPAGDAEHIPEFAFRQVEWCKFVLRKILEFEWNDRIWMNKNDKGTLQFYKLIIQALPQKFPY